VGAWREQDFPVLIPRTVLQECTAHSRTAGDVETGGVLVGNLHRDTDTHDIFACVTAEIRAEHTRADQTSLLFTAQTWADVDAALALRRQEEVMLGWWHSHPHFCRTCPPERQRSCVYSRPFFSEADRSVHRTVFPRGYSVALLLSWLGDDEPSCDLFGWQHAGIGMRGFMITAAGEH
jgi:proteasome lid subunit RPN8/RPN11